MLINCVAYENGERLAAVSVEEIGDYLVRSGCFVWVSLLDPRPEELRLLQKQFALHELAVEDASHGHQRPKFEDYGDSIFGVMHLIGFAESGDLKVGEFDVFVGKNYIVSIRNKSEQDFRVVRDRCEKSPRLLKQGTGFVLYALMDAIVDRYFPVINQLESELDDIESAIFTKGKALVNIRRLYELKGKIVRVKHAVSPMMEELGKLIGTRGPEVCSQSREYFRDVFDHLTRINSALDTLRDTITTAIQVNLSVVAIEDGEVNKKLAAWAGIFAVVTAFAGIWGMNFKYMPELDWHYGYPAAIVVLISAGAYLRYRFKRAGWL